MHPEFETPVERFATWLARLDDPRTDGVTRPVSSEGLPRATLAPGRGQAGVGTLFAVGGGGGVLGPRGLYAAAFVSYEPGSPLTYSELLTARPAWAAPGCEVTDIWVDSPPPAPAGVSSGRSPRSSAHLRAGDHLRHWHWHRHHLERAAWTAHVPTGPGTSPVTARFADLRRARVRLLRGRTRQPQLVGDGPVRTAVMRRLGRGGAVPRPLGPRAPRAARLAAPGATARFLPAARLPAVRSAEPAQAAGRGRRRVGCGAPGPACRGHAGAQVHQLAHRVRRHALHRVRSTARRGRPGGTPGPPRCPRTPTSWGRRPRSGAACS